MKKLGDLMMILDLHRQGMKVIAIARQLGIDRKTVPSSSRSTAPATVCDADLLPEHIRSKALINPPAHTPARRRGRPPRTGGADPNPA